MLKYALPILFSLSLCTANAAYIPCIDRLPDDYTLTGVIKFMSEQDDCIQEEKEKIKVLERLVDFDETLRDLIAQRMVWVSEALFREGILMSIIRQTDKNLPSRIAVQITLGLGINNPADGALLRSTLHEAVYIGQYIHALPWRDFDRRRTLMNMSLGGLREEVRRAWEQSRNQGESVLAKLQAAPSTAVNGRVKLSNLIRGILENLRNNDSPWVSEEDRTRIEEINRVRQNAERWEEVINQWLEGPLETLRNNVNGCLFLLLDLLEARELRFAPIIDVFKHGKP